MFSEQLKKIEAMPSRTVFCLGAGLVIFCQLVAMALVVDDQVKKARMREAKLAFGRMAVAQCMESRIDAVRNSCLQRATAATDPSN